MILGVHCSVRQGYLAALAEASALGVRAMQILPYRRHHEPSGPELAAFCEARALGGVAGLLVHARFVPCPASSDARLRERSRDLLARELTLARALGADAFVLHAGAYSPESTAREGVRFLCEGIAEAAARSGFAAPVLLENVPGGGRRLGGTLEELAAVLEPLSREGVACGACLDTAHAWAAGYDIATAEGMLKFLSRAHRLLGPLGPAAFHLADTRALLGTHLESHERCGEGRLRGEGLKVLLERPEYAGAPAILETPRGDYARDLGYLRGL